MKKVLTILAMIACLVLLHTSAAKENNSQPTITPVLEWAQTKLRPEGTVAIFLSGNDALLTAIMEDALAIHLLNAGFDVTNRETLEKSVGEEIAKMRKSEDRDVSINALEIGKVVNANFILTGTVIFESTEQNSLLGKIASFQLSDVRSGKTLARILFEPKQSMSLSDMSRQFVDFLKKGAN